MIRRSIQVLQYHGRISSMLELGGVAPASNKEEKNIIDTSKNNKVRACILDFDLLVRNTHLTNDNHNKGKANTNNDNNASNNDKYSSSSLSGITPDMEKIKGVASLLNVELGGTMKLSKLEKEQDCTDDLTGLVGYKDITDAKQYDKNETTRTKTTFYNDDTKINMKAPPINDVRAKYASKMRSKLEYGYSPVTMTAAEDNMAKGDAKDLLLAKSIVNKSSNSKWIAGTDTGKLLNYLSSRSMKIALIPPRRKSNNDDDDDITYQRMKDLTQQLPNVNFHVLLKSLPSSSSENMLDKALSKLNDKEETILINPLNILVVSDKDDILSAAKDKGMFSCRVRMNKSSPRGNVSANYNKDNVADIQDVLDDINGISFNTVLSGR